MISEEDYQLLVNTKQSQELHEQLEAARKQAKHDAFMKRIAEGKAAYEKLLASDACGYRTDMTKCPFWDRQYAREEWCRPITKPFNIRQYLPVFARTQEDLDVLFAELVHKYPERYENPEFCHEFTRICATTLYIKTSVQARDLRAKGFRIPEALIQKLEQAEHDERERERVQELNNLIKRRNDLQRRLREVTRAIDKLNSQKEV